MSLGVSGYRADGNSSSSPRFCSCSSLSFPRVPVLRQESAGEGGSMELKKLARAQLMPLPHLLFILQPPSGTHPHRHDLAHGCFPQLPSLAAQPTAILRSQGSLVSVILLASPLLSCVVSICHPLKPPAEKPSKSAASSGEQLLPVLRWGRSQQSCSSGVLVVIIHPSPLFEATDATDTLCS